MANRLYHVRHLENSAIPQLPYEPGAYIKVKQQFLHHFGRDTNWAGKLKVELVNGSILQARNEIGKIASIINITDPRGYNFVDFYEYVISIGKEDAGKLV